MTSRSRCDKDPERYAGDLGVSHDGADESPHETADEDDGKGLEEKTPARLFR